MHCPAKTRSGMQQVELIKSYSLFKQHDTSRLANKEWLPRAPRFSTPPAAMAPASYPHVLQLKGCITH